MNIKDLKYIVAIAEHQHFGKAADAANVSQPTLSGQVKKLEERLGVTIFERSTRGVSTTPIGETIVAKARQIVENVQEIELIASTQSDVLSGALSVGLIPTVAPFLVPHFLIQTLNIFPELKLAILEDQTDNLLQMLENFQIDAAILATDTPSDQFEEIALYQEEFFLLCSKSHPFSKQTNVQMSDIAPIDLLLLSEGHCLRDQTLELCNMNDRNECGPADLRAASLQTLIELVRAGRGYTLLPQLAALPISKRSDLLHLCRIEPRPSRDLRLVFRKSYPRKSSLEALAATIKSSKDLSKALMTQI